jgi:hydrogenase maturation protein HypF
MSLPACRWAIRVRGTVQGVGFRPTVYRLARDAQLGGFVRNDSEGVWIEIEGDAGAVVNFSELLRREAPKHSRIDNIESSELRPLGERDFRVVASAAEEKVRARVPADLATCQECLRELFDPNDRRYRYPFINCTDCGPRYTIVRDIPYDRARTTMDVFQLCLGCRQEYEDPNNRRFHAEPNACPTCGPHLELWARGQSALLGEDGLAAATERIARGEVVAVKGLGGFFLAVEARNERAVAQLRVRKRRPHKPFALMARDLAEAERIAEVSNLARHLLLTPEHPIVLLPLKQSAQVAPSVAPGLKELGVMLPYTPLHHLLLADGPPLLVMTSGNLSEEPIAKDNHHAMEKLGGVADAFLVHDRQIHSRVDDSVVRVIGEVAQPIRRARGFVPDPIPLGFSAPPVLAVGAELKNTICVTRGSEAFISPHIGDLENIETFEFFEETIGKFCRLLACEPRLVAHDLHPDYFSTRWALQSGLARKAVQHHHAHIASCLAEHGREGPVIGIAFDGTGCGPAGDLWGGEILVADLSGFRRIAHLRPIALAGGQAAIQEPWRLAAAVLIDAGVERESLPQNEPARWKAVRQLLDKGLSPIATGAGRWFDAVAALCGIRDEISYEGQAAIELEAIAIEGEAEPYPFELAGHKPSQVDLRPAVRAIATDLKRRTSLGEIAARFHATLAACIADCCRQRRAESDLNTVALSGGCFQNRILSERTRELLHRDGFEVLCHRKVPANDGGLALGQALIAAFRLKEKRES